MARFEELYDQLRCLKGWELADLEDSVERCIEQVVGAVRERLHASWRPAWLPQGQLHAVLGSA